MARLRFIVEEPADHRAAEVVAALREEPVAHWGPSIVVAPAEREGRSVPTDGAALLAGHRPGTPAYDATVLSRPPALVVLDAATQRALRHLGIEAELLPIGPSPAWRGEEGERDLDLVVVDRLTARRARHVAALAPWLARRRCAIHLVDDQSPPVDAPALLARARVALLLHDGAWEDFPRLRALQAALNGCAIVAERSSDAAPFIAGEHFLSAGEGSVALLAELLLDDEGRRAALARRAAGLVAGLPALGEAAELLAATAIRHPPPRPVPATACPLPEPPEPPGAAEEKERRLRELADRRAAARDERVARGLEADPDEVVATSPAYGAATPRVSVLVTVYGHEDYVGAALDSIAASEPCDLELVVVDDASPDRSGTIVADWIEAHPDTPAVLVRHAVNRGLPHARNTALARARGDLVFVLDSDNEVYPRALPRLVEALDADPEAVFAYPTQEMFGPDGALDLRSIHDWDPARFAGGNFIDAMAMIRRDALRALGGYSTDPRLHGWEDYDLWCAVAESGGRGVRVPEILGRYRVAGGSMLSLTDLSVADARAALRERHPRTMG